MLSSPVTSKIYNPTNGPKGGPSHRIGLDQINRVQMSNEHVMASDGRERAKKTRRRSRQCMWHIKELLVLLGGMWRRVQWLSNKNCTYSPIGGRQTNFGSCFSRNTFGINRGGARFYNLRGPN